MKNKIELIYNEKYIKALANHFADIPGYWMQEEIEDFNIIHDNNSDNIKELLSREKIEGSKINNWESNNEGGVYCILFPNTKSVYIGETFNLKRRFSEHYDCLNHKEKYKGKMLKAYEKSKRKCYFIILEHGKVNNLTRAEFKLYCMKRENYYKEVFHNNGYGLYNQEDTLNMFYRAVDALYKYIRLDPNQIRNKYRIHSMQDLEYFNNKPEVEKTALLEHEQRRYEIFSESLKRRFEIHLDIN